MVVNLGLSDEELLGNLNEMIVEELSGDAGLTVEVVVVVAIAGFYEIWFVLFEVIDGCPLVVLESYVYIVFYFSDEESESESELELEPELEVPESGSVLTVKDIQMLIMLNYETIS